MKVTFEVDRQTAFSTHGEFASSSVMHTAQTVPKSCPPCLLVCLPVYLFISLELITDCERVAALQIHSVC